MMIPEKEDGKVEYKLKLLNKSPDRIERLATQMAYRCNEGGSECIYNIGVEDNGTMAGITKEEYEETLKTLKCVADKNDYSVTLLTTIVIDKDKNIYEVLIRENNKKSYIDIKIAVAGSVDTGKSSLMGTLTTGKLDDGRGSARLSVFNFPHEVTSGRTSSIGHQIMGFNSEGKVVNYREVGKMTWPEIVKESSKVISFFDLAGHEKYLKTTILGMTSSYPDLCLIIVGANKGILKMTREHIFLCISLKIPFAIVITKIDMVEDKQNVLDNTMKTIKQILKAPRIMRIPVLVVNKDDSIICAKNVNSESVVPIFQISNVTGKGIDNLKVFFNLLKKIPSNIVKTQNIEFHIDSTFNVTGTGTVVGGHLVSGTVKVGDKLLMGPNNSKYEQVIIKSIYCKKVPLQSVVYGSYVCLGIKKILRENIRRGSVIISPKSDQLMTSVFEVDINVLVSHSTTIKVGYEPVVHTGAIRQSAKLIEIKSRIGLRNSKEDEVSNVLRTGDKAIVVFQFKFQPEYLKKGSRVLFCEGKTKIIGVVL